MASQKRMVDLDELVKKMSEKTIWPLAVAFVREVADEMIASDASTSSPEHRTLTGLPVELQTLKERVSRLDKVIADWDPIVARHTVEIREAQSSVKNLEKGDELLSPVIDAFNASFNAADARFKKLGNDIAELQAKVRALASPVKLYVTPVGTDQFGEPKADAFFQAPDPPKPTPPPCPEGYEHLDPPAYRLAKYSEWYFLGLGDVAMRAHSDHGEGCHAVWIIRPKAAPAAEQKQEWKVGDVAEFDLSDDGKRSIKAPIYQLANGIASFYVLGIETQALVVALRRPGGAK